MVDAELTTQTYLNQTQNIPSFFLVLGVKIVGKGIEKADKRKLMEKES
jgi:hypothetical protein